MNQPTNGDMVLGISNEILHAGASDHPASKYQDLDDGHAARYMSNGRRYSMTTNMSSDERVA